MKNLIFGFIAILSVSNSQACTVFLQDRIELQKNDINISNRDRLALTRHYLAAKEWTKEGTNVTVEAAAFDSEANPKELATRRGSEVKKFLMLLGLASDDIIVDERIIKIKNGKIDPDDKLQIGVEFVPKCPPAGCQSLCNIPNLQGVASYAVTSETPGPAPESNTFSCGDKREPKYGRIIRKEIWTESTKDKVITLSTDGVKPRSGICYRITTSAHRYVGMTDDQGRTQPIQLLGPEYTTIEVKVDQYAN